MLWLVFYLTRLVLVCFEFFFLYSLTRHSSVDAKLVSEHLLPKNKRIEGKKKKRERTKGKEEKRKTKQKRKNKTKEKN